MLHRMPFSWFFLFKLSTRRYPLFCSSLFMLFHVVSYCFRSVYFVYFRFIMHFLIFFTLHDKTIMLFCDCCKSVSPPTKIAAWKGRKICLNKFHYAISLKMALRETACKEKKDAGLYKWRLWTHKRKLIHNASAGSNAVQNKRKKLMMAIEMASLEVGETGGRVTPVRKRRYWHVTHRYSKGHTRRSSQSVRELHEWTAKDDM